MTCVAGVPRPPRPLPFGARMRAFLVEILDDAVADDLVVPSKSSDGPGYMLTAEGQEWLRDFPSELLLCYPEHRRGVRGE